MCVTVRERAKKSKVERVREREKYIYIYYIRRESFCSSKRAKLREKADAFCPPLETETLKTIYP